MSSILASELRLHFIVSYDGRSNGRGHRPERATRAPVRCTAKFDHVGSGGIRHVALSIAKGPFVLGLLPPCEFAEHLAVPEELYGDPAIILENEQFAFGRRLVVDTAIAEAERPNVAGLVGQ